MLIYILKRLSLIPPTLIMILTLNFIIVQLAPTGPIDTALTQIHNQQMALSAHTGGIYQGADGLNDAMIDELNAQFGFDKPIYERYWSMLSDYIRLELGRSFFKGQNVSSLISEKLPISLAFGVYCLLLVYGFGFIIGMAKVYYHGRAFDKFSSIGLSLAYAVPSFIMGLLLLIAFTGGRYWHIFPMQVSLSTADITWSNIGRIIYELTLPAIAASLAGIASVAYLAKYSIQAELDKPYIIHAHAQGVGRWQLIQTHVLKNALLPILSEMPTVVVGVLLGGHLLMEILFGIDGLGRLGYEAVIDRDYPVMFGVLYIFTLAGMALQLLFDVLFALIDPKIRYD